MAFFKNHPEKESGNTKGNMKLAKDWWAKLSKEEKREYTDLNNSSDEAILGYWKGAMYGISG